MAKHNTVVTEGISLARGKWRPYMESLVKGYKGSHAGKAPDANILATTAMMLENTDRMIKRMDETTKVVNLGNFTDYGFGIITALMPSLVANDIVSVQPLKARTGVIFYLDFKYGTNKGDIKAGTSMISPFTGANTDTYYSSEEASETFATVAAGATEVEGTITGGNLIPGSVKVAVTGNLVAVDDGEGKFTIGEQTGVGSINYETGAFSFEIAAQTTAVDPIATFKQHNGTDTSISQWDYSNNPTANIPEVDIELGSLPINTVSRRLRARWLFDAAFELQQTHGVDADLELSAAMTSEVRHEIDGEIMNDLLISANAGGIEFIWNKTHPVAIPYVDYKDTFVDTLIQMSNAIFQDTRRAEGNFVVAGVNVCSIIESLAGRFVPDSNGPKAGPHFIGVLDGRWKVYKNPFYGPDQFLVGYKGDSYLEGGYVYAPYLPIYTTPTIMLDDFVNRKGVATRYGKKLINSKFYAKGRIVAEAQTPLVSVEGTTGA